MKINNISLSILFTITGISLEVYSMEQTERKFHSNELNNSWLPKRLQNQKDAIEKLIDSEKPKLITPTVRNENISYGRNFIIDDAQRLCLHTISNLYEINEKRPITADIAAGHGYMTWKMLLAGADVTAVEPQDPARSDLVENAKKTIPFLRADENLKTVCRSSKASALDFENAYIYKNKENHYDVIWTGNFIHLLTPKEATSYVSNLYHVTKQGGYVFATAYGPILSKEMASCFLQKKENGEEYPGYIIANVSETGYLIRTNPINKSTQVMKTNNDITYSPLSVSLQDHSPIERVPDFYNEKISKVQTQKQQGGVLRPYGEEYKDANGAICQRAASIYHRAYHAFDTDTFRWLFEKAGFSIEDVFYMDIQTGKRLEGKISLLDDIDTHLNKIWVGIKAKKI